MALNNKDETLARRKTIDTFGGYVKPLTEEERELAYNVQPNEFYPDHVDVHHQGVPADIVKLEKIIIRMPIMLDVMFNHFSMDNRERSMFCEDLVTMAMRNVAGISGDLYDLSDIKQTLLAASMNPNLLNDHNFIHTIGNSMHDIQNSLYLNNIHHRVLSVESVTETSIIMIAEPQ